MIPHAFTKAPNADLCTCGKVLFHEDHFGGSRQRAAEAYRTMQVERALPAPPAFASIEDADAWLEQRARDKGIYVEPTPEFATVQEADAWLAERAACAAAKAEEERAASEATARLLRDGVRSNTLQYSTTAPMIDNVKWDNVKWDNVKWHDNLITATWDPNISISDRGYTRAYDPGTISVTFT